MSERGTIRSLVGRLEVVSGSMGVGYVLVAEDGRLGATPIASVNVPFKSNGENLAVAQCIADAWNDGIRQE